MSIGQISINDYFNEKFGSSEFSDSLSKTFIDSPISHMYIPDTGFEPAEYATYKQSGMTKLAGATNALFERSLGVLLNSEVDPKMIQDVFAVELTSIENQKIYYLFLQIARFKLLNLGNCSERASYAAFQLVDYFEEVKVLSNTKKDQFFVSLDNDYIYDPLVNPRVLFTKAFHESEVMSKFPNSDRDTTPFSVRVTKELSGKFNAQWPCIQNKIISLLKPIQNSQTLLRDFLYVNVLLKNEYQIEQMSTAASVATEKYNQFVAKLKIEQQESVVISSSMTGSSAGITSSCTSALEKTRIENSLNRLCGGGVAKLYTSGALITLKGMSLKLSHARMVELNKLRVMKLNHTKLKGSETYALLCTEINVPKLFKLAGDPVVTPSSIPSSSSSDQGLAFSFE